MPGRFGLALGLVTLATLLGLPLAGWLTEAGAIPLYLLAILACSCWLGFWPSIAASFAAFLALNYFFIEPRYTFEVAQPRSWPALIGLLVVCLVVSSLVRRLTEQTRLARRASLRAETARDLAQVLAGKTLAQQVFDAACERLAAASGAVVTVRRRDGSTVATAGVGGAQDSRFDPRLGQWAISNGRMAGPGTGNWPEGPALLVPLERHPGGDLVVVFEPAAGADIPIEPSGLRDLVDQVALARQRVMSLERIEQSQAQAREEAIRAALLASIAHDMRTPLTAILGAATSLLQQRENLGPAEQAALLESMSAEARHLSDATANVLALVRLESGAMVQLEWQSLEEIVGATLARYRARLPAAALRAEVQPSARLVRADASLLAQALSNLIDNALAVQPAGEPVLVSVCERPGELELSVTDRGPGWPAGFDASRIRKFQRFGSGKGYGLGLAIVQAIAQAHGARLSLDGAPGRGAVASLRFAAREFEPQERA